MHVSGHAYSSNFLSEISRSFFYCISELRVAQGQGVLSRKYAIYFFHANRIKIRSDKVGPWSTFCESNFFAAKFENVTARMLKLEKIRFARKNSLRNSSRGNQPLSRISTEACFEVFAEAFVQIPTNSNLH